MVHVGYVSRVDLRALMSRNKRARQRTAQEKAAQAAQATQARKALKREHALQHVSSAEQATSSGDLHAALEHLLSAYSLDPQLEGLEDALHGLYVRLQADASRARQPHQHAEPSAGRSRGSFERQQARGFSFGNLHFSYEPDTAAAPTRPASGPAAVLSAMAPHVLGVVLVLFWYKALWRALAGSFVWALAVALLAVVRPVGVAQLVGAKWLVLSLLVCNPGKVWVPFWWCLLRSRAWAIPSTFLALMAHGALSSGAELSVAIGTTVLGGLWALLPVRWWITRTIFRLALAGFSFVLAAALLYGGREDSDQGAHTEHARGDVVDEDVVGHGLSTAVPRGASDPEVVRILGCTTWHEVLQVDTSADATAIRRAQRAKALFVHPDKCKDAHATRAFRRVMSALDVLSDDNKRLSYEAGLRQRGLQ